jgi:uncharacterized membrane protein YeaQ/YmgE (transglycosylase-associated protein family)
MIGFLVGLLIVGVIAGYLARLIVPGEDPLSFWMTLAIGVVGSYVGGLIGWAIFGRDDAIGPAGIIASIVGAVIVLVAYNALAGRSKPSRA